MNSALAASLTGLLEGITRFLPVSADGHLTLAAGLMPREVDALTFRLAIELGAALGVLLAYARSILRIGLHLGSQTEARRFCLTILAATMPAVGLYAVAHDAVDLMKPGLIGVALILMGGGLVLLVVDAIRPRPRVDEATDVPLSAAVVIGVAQALALVPGIACPVVTVIVAMLSRIERRAAAAFSYALGAPMLIGMVTIDALRNGPALDFARADLLGLGCGAAALGALLAVAPYLALARHAGFGPLALYRILVGTFVIGLMMAR